MRTYTLSCFMCGQENSEDLTNTYCTACGGVLTVRYHGSSPAIQYPLETVATDELRTQPTELRKLHNLSRRYGIEIWGKLEYQNPSGCFKDRGSFIEVQKALELNRDAICLASTGNMAASVAMYACYYNIPCYVFVPENTTEGKLAQASIYNATVLRIKGDFSACEQLCKAFARSGNYYLAGDYVFREEGQKSVSYEILHQQEHDFDAVLVPVGCGTNFGAIHKGYHEALQAGLTKKIPALICVQPETSSPVVEGIFKREKVIKPSVTTMATAVAAADPIDFHKVQKGIEETDGRAFTVTESDILESLQEMAVSEGIFTEPACALPLAALKKEQRWFTGKRCLLMLTGTGLKDTGVVARNVLPSPVLPNDVAQVIDFIESGYPQLQRESFGKPRDTVLTQIRFSSDKQERFEDYLNRIGKKGKTLTPRETEAIQTLVFNDDSDLNFPLKVTDYTILMRKHGLVAASVLADKGGTELETSHEGVGPLDAVLGAMDKLTAVVFPVSLVDHALEVLSPGTNALVVASITLEHNGNQAQGKAVSPDVIEAGLHAWIKAFAVLHKRYAQ